MENKINNKWIRIYELDVNCPICGKPDWCRISEDGKQVLCSRVPRYSQQGTIHKVDNNITVTKSVIKKYPPINWNVINKGYKKNLSRWRLRQFAALKGLTPKSLLKLELGYDGDAYTFPIKNDDFNIIGIQRQFPDGKKIMVKGSKIGVFIPTDYVEDNTVITEGVSDCAAAIDLHLNAIGRLNNSSGADFLLNICKTSNVLIVSDNDEHKAGQNGAIALANKFKQVGKKVKVLIPPKEYKDLRNWKVKGKLSFTHFHDITERIPYL